MTNPTRPATGGVIATSWGLSVADTVVRRYPNAATRDADLTGHTAADLLGQVVVLTDTGAVLVYASALLGWRPPWNLPWGRLTHSMAAVQALWVSGNTQTLIVNASLGIVAGRQYRVDYAVNMFATQDGWVDLVMISTTQRQNVLTDSARSRLGYPFAGMGLVVAPATQTASFGIYTGGPLNAGGADANHMSTWSVSDVGPAANPTALAVDADGVTFVDVQSLEPEYVDLWTPGE